MLAEVKTNAMRILDKNKVDYLLHTYQPGESVDGISVAQHLGKPQEVVYKTLVTQGKTGGYYVFVIPVAQELDLKKAAKAVGEKAVEMIPVKEINKVTGYIRGGCSPVGMKKQFPTVINSTAQNLPFFCVSGGRIGSQVELNPLSLAELIEAKFVDIVM